MTDLDTAGLPGTRTDADLVAALNAGDASAFDALYSRHRDWVVALAFRFTGDRDLALDVLQETFLYFVKKFPGFELTAALRTFFYPGVKNLSIAARRTAARVQSTEAEQEHLASAPAPAASAGEPDTLAAVLALLSEEHREALLLRFVDGLSLAEIAAATGVPLGTVKSRLHHALATLRRGARVAGRRAACG
jgi:RNA polymerase sigma-70 factor (ECF subfamily)